MRRVSKSKRTCTITCTIAKWPPVNGRPFHRITNVYAGAGRGGRTPTRLPSADFESAASASSAIPALHFHSPNDRHFQPVSAVSANPVHPGESPTQPLPCDLIFLPVSHSHYLSTPWPRRFGQSHAAPRTPLESPYFAGKTGVDTSPPNTYIFNISGSAR
jgi:hypothetical protein